MVGIVEQVALALMVFVIMLGMGATVRLSHLKQVLEAPKALVIGVLCQFGLMPLIALGLAMAFDLPEAIALSLILVGSTPGGTTSNLFTYYAKGDVALSISMTVASTMAAIVLMPLALSVYAAEYTSGDLDVPMSNIIVTLVLVMVPVAIGMIVLWKNERVARILEKASGVVGFLLIGALIAKFLIENSGMFLSTHPNVIVAGILLGLVGFLLGYLLARTVGLTPIHARTVSLETGIQNTPITVAIIAVSFSAGAQQDEMLLLPTFYAFFIVITSAVVSLGFRTLQRD
ncbi:MAG: bile acid:sodium symporter [Pseudomonadota bacterium]